MTEKKVTIELDASQEELILLQSYITEIQQIVENDRSNSRSIIVKDTLLWHIDIIERLHDALGSGGSL